VQDGSERVESKHGVIERLCAVAVAGRVFKSGAEEAAIQSIIAELSNAVCRLSVCTALCILLIVP
jgi:hypothetical protein